MRYCDDGHLEIDNNATERALRAVALGRKNYLFAGSDRGGESSFVVYLIAWALIHGLLVATLMRWFSIAAMTPFLAIELTLGLFVADYFFDIRPEKEKQ